MALAARGVALLRLTGAEGLGGRWRLCVQQQRCGFKKATRKPELRRAEEDVAPKDPSLSKDASSPRDPSSLRDSAEARLAPRDPAQVKARGPHEAHSEGPYREFGQLVKPLLFTVGFTGCAFGAAAIWQYESLKSRVQSYFSQIQTDWFVKQRPKKRGDLREEMNEWWNGLTEGQRTVTGIIAVNALVFCCWRIPPLQRSMSRYFTANPASKTLCSPMLLSTFSHYSLIHLACNMFVLWSFANSAVSMLGQEQFMAVYLSAGVISSFFSYVAKTATGRFGPSLGASGAIMSILAANCTKMPEDKLAIIFLPMFTFTAENALKVLIAVDAAGLILGWRFFDHAAHLGGALFGIWYVSYGHELIWKKREPFVKLWHDFRTRGGGGGGSRGDV